MYDTFAQNFVHGMVHMHCAPSLAKDHGTLTFQKMKGPRAQSSEITLHNCDHIGTAVQETTPVLGLGLPMQEELEAWSPGLLSTPSYKLSPSYILYIDPP